MSLAILYESQNNVPKAIECYEKASNVSRKAGDRKVEGMAFLNLGILYRDRSSPSDLPKAIKCFEKASNNAKEAGDREIEGKAYLNLGMVYESRSDLPKAIECFEKALNYAREAGDRTGEGNAYFGLEAVYESSNDLPKAIECLEKALHIVKEGGHAANEAKVYESLGACYHSNNDVQNAIYCFEKALNIVREAGDQDKEMKSCFNLGIVYHSQGKFPKAIEWFEKALNMARKVGDVLVIFRACHNLEDCYLEIGNLLKASEYRKMSLFNPVGALTEETTEEPACNLQVIPPDINLRGPRAVEAHNRALTEVRKIPVMSIGQDHSGKTSLKKSLQGLRLNPDEDSIVGIDVDPSYFKETTEIWKTEEKDQAANKEEMAASFEHHVARVVVDILREQELTSEEKTMIIHDYAFGRSQISVQEGVERRSISIEDRTEEAGTPATEADTLPNVIKSYEESLHIAREEGDRATEGYIYFHLGKVYQSHRDLPNAIDCYEKALNKAGDRAIEADSYFHLGSVYNSLGDLPKAIECCEKSLHINRGKGGRKEATVCMSLGILYKSQNDVPKAIECYEKASNVARKAGDRQIEGMAFLNLGRLYRSSPSDLPKAIKCFEKASNNAKEAGDRETEGKACLNLGMVYESCSDLPKAMECLEKALNYAREAGDRNGEGNAYFGLVAVYQSSNDLPKAIECLEKALHIVREGGHPANKAKVYESLGALYYRNIDLPKAINCWEKTSNIAREAGDLDTEGKAYCNLGIVYHYRGNLPKAIEYYEKGLNIATKTGDELVIFRACENLEDCHLALGNLLKASEYRKKSLSNRVGALTEEATEGSACNLQVTPPEINLRGPRALEAYNRALTEGRTRVRRIPIMLIGQDRSGKTSLKKSLQGLRFNPDEDSTVGIDVDPSYFKVTTEIWKTGEKDQAANKEKIAASFEHHVARITFENLREQELTSKVKTMDKSKDLESSPTISTEAETVSESNEIPEDHQGLSIAIIHDQAGSSAGIETTAEIETEDYAGSSKSSGDAHVGGGNRGSQITENYPAPMKARDNIISSGMIPKDIETLIKKLRDKVDKVCSDDDIYSVLWDFAGQSVYYETHQLFLTSRAIYLLVYNLSRDPEGIAESVEKQGLYKKFEERSSTKTNLDCLDYWMTSVYSQSSRIQDHDLCSASTSTVLPKTLPPVFLVCTHSDQPFGGKDPTDLALEVYGFLKTKSYGEQLFHDVFKVDNTKSGTQKECPEVKRLRESILAVAMELPQTKENIPIKWLKYEEALQGALDEGHKWITIEDAKRIASEVCQIHDEQEFVTVLDFFHDQRILIHFADTVELNKLVVLHPQWLIDVFKTVITVKRYDKQERGLNDLWLKLEREGILEEKLLQHTWGQIVEENHTFESLIAIMEKFSLLCSWSLSNEPGSKEYLVPSMLEWYPPQKIKELITSASIPPLFFKFKSGQVPSNLFPRLVVQFLQWGRTEFWSTVNPLLYKNFARIYTAKDVNYSVVLLCHSSLIEVVVLRVHRNDRSPLKDDLQADLGNSPGDQRDSFEVFCAREVYRRLVLLLECLRKEFCWLKRMKYQAGIICPVCSHKRVVDHCRTHHKQDCEQEECLHFIPESELRNSNQHVICTRSAVAVNNKICSKDFSAWFASPHDETTADANGGRLSCSRRESEDKSVTLPGNVVESLVSPSCDPKGIVRQLQENLHLDQTDLEKPTPETKRMIRCFAEKAKDSNRIDVVKHLREITPAGTTGPLLPGKLDVWDIPVEKMRELTIDLTVTDWQWRAVAEKLGLRPHEIEFLDMRYKNPCDAALAFLAQRDGMNVGDLYDVLTECGMPMLADIL
ncbi:uncharacterized protein LOC114949826 isoform X1 [Acropora millepora]|uniref:uncharacterized protein LOC114949826 isoform X1 n=1 Tax=Acropora millepora TaxID=45264 RepID=UPI001CF1BB29|nr:uncharacterized protein LOC114949826 isoform X1 [Acropora millepora]